MIYFPKMGRNDKDLFCFVYSFYDCEGNLKESKEGTLEWVLTNEILNRPTWEADHIFLPWVLENKLFSAKFVYDNKGSLLEHSVHFQR